VVDVVPCGQLLSVDSEGFLLSRADASLIQSPWREAVADLAERYADVAGVGGLFVRGSVATGAAVPGIADFDYIVLVDGPPDEELLDELDAHVLRAHPRIGKVDRLEVQWQSSAPQLSEWTAFILACQSAWISGHDVAPTLPRFTPGLATRLNSRGFDSWLEARLGELDADTSPVEANVCTWLMKWLLRVAFEVVMERDQSYTRDLYPCWDRFGHYYPARHWQARDVLEWALNPIRDRSHIREQVADLGGFLRDELIAIGYLEAVDGPPS